MKFSGYSEPRRPSRVIGWPFVGMCSKLGIKIVKSRPRHPQSQGKLSTIVIEKKIFNHQSSRSFALVSKKAPVDFLLCACGRQPYTVRCRYNAVNFRTNIQIRRPIALSWGWGMGCVFWVQHQIDNLLEFLQWYLQYHVILGRFITARDCTEKWLLLPIRTLRVVHSRNILLDTNVILNQTKTPIEDQFGLLCNGIVIETAMLYMFSFLLQAPRCRSK